MWLIFWIISRSTFIVFTAFLLIRHSASNILCFPLFVIIIYRCSMRVFLCYQGFNISISLQLYSYWFCKSIEIYEVFEAGENSAGCWTHYYRRLKAFNLPHYHIVLTAVTFQFSHSTEALLFDKTCTLIYPVIANGILVYTVWPCTFAAEL